MVFEIILNKSTKRKKRYTQEKPQNRIGKANLSQKVKADVGVIPYPPAEQYIYYTTHDKLDSRYNPRTSKTFYKQVFPKPSVKLVYY